MRAGRQAALAQCLLITETRQELEQPLKQAARLKKKNDHFQFV